MLRTSLSSKRATPLLAGFLRRELLDKVAAGLGRAGRRTACRSRRVADRRADHRPLRAATARPGRRPRRRPDRPGRGHRPALPVRLTDPTPRVLQHQRSSPSRPFPDSAGAAAPAQSCEEVPLDQRPPAWIIHRMVNKALARLRRTVPDVVDLSDIGPDDLVTVGGKALNLGRMLRADLPVPPGFCVTTPAYRRVVGDRLADVDRRPDGASTTAPDQLAEQLRRIVLDAPVPDDLAEAIAARYRALGDDVAVAVRSSATAEDLPGASFAGQQDTYLNVVGADAVLDAARRCWASLWTERAVSYRTHPGHRPRRGPAGGGRAADGRRGGGGGDVHRQSRHRQPAAAGRRRQSRARRGGRVRSGQPGPLRRSTPPPAQRSR